MVSTDPTNNNGRNSPSLRRPMSSFQPASSLPRDMNSPAALAASSNDAAATSSSSNANSSSSSGGAAVVQPRPRPLIRGTALGGGTSILVNNCQRGNPILTHIRNIGWEYADVVPDYQVGLSSCVLFLSIRYHRLHPEYVHTRIAKLAQMFTLRVLLVLCDVNDHQSAIKELTKTCLINNLTLIVAWSAEEAGRYIETYKSFEHKPPDLIKERVAEDYLSQVTNVLTQVRGVNKTDVVTLLTRFGSVKGVVRAVNEEQGGEGVGMCPGFGEVKAKRLRETLTMPFRSGEVRSYKERKLGTGQVVGSTAGGAATGGGAARAAAGGLAGSRGTAAAATATLGGATTTTTTAAGGSRGAAANASLELQDDLLAPSSDDQRAASTPTQPAREPQPERALSTLESQLDDLEELDEEQQLQMAMRMSMQP